MSVIDLVEKQHLRKQVPSFDIGDTVDVHVNIREGDKERIQIFNGIVIRRRGRGVAETFTVRRIVQGEGVERIFPLHSSNVVDVVVQKRGRVRRAKLYYLRKRVGKGTRVRERLWSKDVAEAEKVAAAPAAAAAAAAGPPVEGASDAPAPAPTDGTAASATQAEAESNAAKKKAEMERKARAKAKKASRRDAKKKAPKGKSEADA